jgi:two-component sensor histidine kinase
MVCRKKLKRYTERCLLVLAMIFIVLQPGFSQSQQTPNELLPLLKKNGSGIERVYLLLKLADYYVESEWNYANKIKVDSALPYLLESKRISDSLQNKGYIYETLRRLGNYYFRCDKTDSASGYYTQLIVLQRNAGEQENEAVNWQLFAHKTPFLENFLDTIVYRYQQALAIYRKMQHVERQAKLLALIGEIHIEQGKFFEAEQAFLEALSLQKNAPLENICLTWWGLSKLHRKKGNYDKAIAYGLKSIEGIQSVTDKIAAAIYTEWVGRLYADIGKPDTALRFFYRALEILEKNTNADWRNKNEQYDIINQMVQAFLQTGKTREALGLLKRTEKSTPPDNDYTRLIFSKSMGNCNKGLIRFNDAEHYYLQALAITERTGQIVETTHTLFSIAELYVSWKRYDKASAFIARLLKQPKGLTTTINQSEISLLQFKVDSATGDYMSAIHHYQKYKELNDSIFTVEKARQLDELQIRYRTVKNEQEIQSLQNKAKLQAAEFSKEKFIKKIILAGIMLLSIILILSLRAYRLKQRTNRQLETSKEQISRANLSLQHIIQEKEWLIKEIHHRVKNNLHTIISLLDSQSAYLQDSGEQNAIRDAQRRVHAMSLLHQKLYLSSDLNSINMALYIQELVAYLGESFNTNERIQFKLDIEPIILDVSPAVTVALILNESITNALKYAFPGNRPGVISIILKTETAFCYKLSIIDNGIGLPVKFDFYSHASLGLNLIQGLAEDIDGHFSIVSEEGTCISISFPNNPDIHPTKNQLSNQHKNENESIYS